MLSIFEERVLHDPNKIREIISYLRTGNLIDFQLNAAIKLRLKFKLIGFELGNFLICSVPNAAYQDKKLELNAGHTCVLRAVIGGDLGHCIAFQAKVMSLVKVPRPMVFVSWPSTVENFRLRKEQRISAHIPASFEDQERLQGQEDNYHILEGTVMDLSVGGCLFQLPWSTQAGLIPIKNGLLKMKFPGQPDDPLLVPAEVRRSQRHNQELMHLGLQFEPIEELIELFHHMNMEKRS